MKYLLITIDGHGMPLAHHLQEEGEEVLVGQVQSWEDIGNAKRAKDEEKEPKQREARLSLFDGILNKMTAEELIRKAATIKNKDEWRVITDFNHLWKYAGKLRAMGFQGLLPNEADARLEEKRDEAKNLVNLNYPDVEVADTHRFKAIEEGIAFLKENKDTLFVLKGFGEEAKTIVPTDDDPETNHSEIEDALKTDKKDYEAGGYIFEEKIPDMTEFVPEAIASNGKLLGVNINIETKYLGAGNVGRQTGCAQSVTMWLEDYELIYGKFLKPIELFMVRDGELTYWDAGIAYSPSRKKFYFLEYCSDRMGFNAIFDEIATFGSAKAYFDSIWNGSVKPRAKMGASVRLFNVDPVEKDSKFIAPFDPDVWMWDAKKKGENFVTAGFDKNLAVISGKGGSLQESVDDAYRNLKKFKWTDKMYRPKFDFLSFDYPTSIPNRIKGLSDLFDIPMASKNRMAMYEPSPETIDMRPRKASENMV